MSSDAGNSDVPNGSQKVLPLGEKWKLSLNEEEKKSQLRVAKTYHKNNSVSVKLWRRKKGFVLIFLFNSEPMEITTTCDRCDYMEKALNLLQ